MCFKEVLNFSAFAEISIQKNFLQTYQKLNPQSLNYEMDNYVEKTKTFYNNLDFIYFETSSLKFRLPVFKSFRSLKAYAS